MTRCDGRGPTIDYSLNEGPVQNKIFPHASALSVARGVAMMPSRTSGFPVPVREVGASTGAGALYALPGEMGRKPGPPSEPDTWKIDLDEDGNVVDLF